MKITETKKISPSIKELLFKQAYSVLDSAYYAYKKMIEELELKKKLSPATLDLINQELRLLLEFSSLMFSIYRETNDIEFLKLGWILNKLLIILDNREKLDTEIDNALKTLFEKRKEMRLKGIFLISYTELFKEILEKV